LKKSDEQEYFENQLEIINDAQQMLLTNNDALFETALRCIKQWRSREF
jgi:hypothetical protein